MKRRRDMHKGHDLGFYLTRREFDKVKETDFCYWLTYYIIREQSAAESGNRTRADFEVRAGEEYYDRGYFACAAIDPNTQHDLDYVCKFYDKSEAEVARHILYAMANHEYDTW